MRNTLKIQARRLLLANLALVAAGLLTQGAFG